MAPQIQKALVVESAHAPWTLRTDWPVPTPGPDEVLVKIIATALNPADWKCQVVPPPFITYPFLGGFDGAGIVEEVGADVSSRQKGERMYVRLRALPFVNVADWPMRCAVCSRGASSPAMPRSRSMPWFLRKLLQGCVSYRG